MSFNHAKNHRASPRSYVSKLYRSLNRVLLAAVVMPFMAGCAAASTDNSDSLSDANIAAIVVGANNIDISAGKIAIERSTNQSVRKFAQTMIDDHSAVLASAVDLVTKLGVTPVNNDLVAVLAAQSKAHETSLKSLTGQAFDKSYIDHEVAYHEAVIGVIEEQLIPGAKNAELKSLLVSVLPAFKAHLAHCKMLQSKI